MSVLNPEQTNVLMAEARDCLFALTPGRAMFVEDDDTAQPSPSLEQSAWYFGFIYGWASTKLREMGVSNLDLTTAFVMRVFEHLFAPIGCETFDRIVTEIKAGRLQNEVNAAIKEFEGWDGGEFVPLPPSA